MLRNNTQVEFRVTDTDGNFLGTYINWSTSSFSSKINSTPENCDVKIATPSIVQGEEFVQIGYTVEIVVFNRFNINGKTVYKGKIRSIDETYDGTSVSYDISLSGIAEELANRYYQNSSDVYQYDVNDSIYNALKNILDRYENYFPSEISYDSNSLSNSGPLSSQNVDITLNSPTYLECIEAVVKNLPENYFWRIDNSGKFIVDNFDKTSYTHFFSFGYNITSLTKSVNSKNLVNEYLAVGDSNITVKKQDTNSISKYGKKTKQEKFSEFNDTTSLGNYIDRKLNLLSEPQVELTFTVIGAQDPNRGYDIESVQPGDTFFINDFDTESRFVTQVNYDFNTVEISTAVIQNEITQELNKIKDKQSQSQRDSSPTTY